MFIYCEFFFFYPQSTDIRTICREFEHAVKFVVFGFPTKNHPQTLVLKLEKHRKTIGPNGWAKIIAPIAMVRNGQKHRHRIAVMKKPSHRIAIKNWPSLKSSDEYIRIFWIRIFIRLLIRIKIFIQIYSDIRSCQKNSDEYIRIFVRGIFLTRIYSDIRLCQNPYECHTLL